MTNQRTLRSRRPPVDSSSPRHGLARNLSRLGVCSRAEAERRVRAGRVRVNGVVVTDPELPVEPASDRIELDGVVVGARSRVYIAINKPRGLVVSTADEHGRDTVYAALDESGLPWLAPVGRLDKASEGLLLMSNDPAWAARITDPASRIAKTYRVQVHGRPDAAALQRMCAGIRDRGEFLSADSVAVVGGGATNTWCEVVLHAGRNRELRRLFGACGCGVVRLVRIAIGPVVLGPLAKGAWRRLTPDELAGLDAAMGGGVSLPPAPRQRSTSR